MARPPAPSLPPPRRRLRLRRQENPSDETWAWCERAFLLICGAAPVLPMAGALLRRVKPINGPTWAFIALIAGPPLLLMLVGALGPARLVQWAAGAIGRLMLLYAGVAATGSAVLLEVLANDPWLRLIAALLLLFGTACLAACVFASERLLVRIFDIVAKLGL